MSTTPNMGLTVPDVGTAGPDWAEELNADLATIDSHDHSTGHGAPISHTSVTGLGSMATQSAGAVAITGGTVKGLPDPTDNQDAATKAYVDSHSGATDAILP